MPLGTECAQSLPPSPVVAAQYDLIVVNSPASLSRQTGRATQIRMLLRPVRAKPGAACPGVTGQAWCSVSRQPQEGRAWMIATTPPPNDVVSFGPFRLFAAERLLEKGDEPVLLGGRALDLLIALVERAGEVISQRHLISQAWPRLTVEEANLRVQIAGLRKALGDGQDGAHYVINVPGRGYCFVAPVTRSTERRAVSPVAAAVAQSARDLPRQLTRMIGRDETIVAVSAQVMMWRFVSIVGPGGIGKTTVAISVAHMLLDGFDGAVFFIDLAELMDPQHVATAVAVAVGCTVQTQEPLLGLLAFLANKKVLLVLDNCEHVIEVVASLAERVVSETAQAHVLTTSREALRVDGEHVHLLHALAYPPNCAGLTAAEALTYPAVQLYMQRASASGHRSELSDADAPVVARICQRLDGMALAIELAASHTGSFGIRGTEGLLDNRFGLVWQGRRTALPRHQTLNAMLDWSYNLLAEHEQVILRRLSVFVGDFTIQAARSVLSEDTAQDANVMDAIVGLVAKSLISTSVSSDSTYYRLLDTTRTYAADKLAKCGETGRLSRQHAISYADLLERDDAVQSSFGQRDRTAYSRQIGNIRAALGWALSDHGDTGVSIRLAAAAAPVLIGLSLLRECGHWCGRAIAALDDTYRGSRQEMVLQEALALSSMFTSGHSDQVRRALERGLELAETFEDYTRQLRFLTGLNLFLTRLGNFYGALAIAQRGSIVAKVAGDPAGIVSAEWILGTAHHGLGNQAASQRHSEQGMELAIEYGTTNVNFFGCDQRIRTLLNLARTLWLRGFPDRALNTARQVINEAAKQDDPVSVCTSLVYAATVFVWAGELSGADHLLDRLIAYAGQHSLDPSRAAGIALRGEIAIARNETEAGLELLRSALETLNKGQYNVLMSEIRCALAEGLRRTGYMNEALVAIDNMTGYATESGAKFYLPELMRMRARILASMSQPDRASAVDCLNEAIAVAREQSALALQLRSATDLARLLAECGEREQARRVLCSVYDCFTEGFDTADLKVARDTLAELS
jgi:predicted ATPase/DNA-binding winged helix-turn-helix (wHTH) protein